ncbi:hypothetical protein [Mesorhizobium sp. 1M-11]|uniref:hypothetical protein n=1 Tax=Mesorhizobium sp. 1M-11 TaxID=1529006 RepID=UPI0006C74898|nr:hypothetical protein [Mesorhizobium sp. 1M-11]
MSRINAAKHDQLPTQIRRQFSDRSNQRFLHSLPAFRVVNEIPEPLRTLLDRLDAQENSTQSR